MRYYENLEDMLCNELDKIANQGELTAGTLDTVQKLTHSLKSLKTIEAMDGHSGSYPHYYGNSYRRDSMGRYSREGETEHMLRTIEDLKKEIEKMK